MRIFVPFFLGLIFYLGTAGTSCAQVDITTTEEKLPVFNTPFIKGYESFYLIEKDPVNNITYVGHVSCSSFKIIGLTSDPKILLNDRDADNLVETAHDYADIFCPDSKKTIFMVTDKLDNIDDANDLFFKALITKESGVWIEEKDKRINAVKSLHIQKEEETAKEIEDKSLTERFAFLLGVSELDDVKMLALYSLLDGNKNMPLGAMVHIEKLEDGFAVASWPAPLVLKSDVKFNIGYALVYGTLKAMGKEEKRRYGLDAFLSSEVTVEKYINCRRKGCAEFKDVKNVLERLEQ